MREWTLPADVGQPLGMAWDAKRQLLWIATDCLDVAGLTPCDRGALIAVDRAGRVRKRLAAPAPFHVGDVSARDGEVFVADSRNGAVYRVAGDSAGRARRAGRRQERARIGAVARRQVADRRRLFAGHHADRSGVRRAEAGPARRQAAARRRWPGARRRLVCRRPEWRIGRAAARVPDRRRRARREGARRGRRCWPIRRRLPSPTMRSWSSPIRAGRRSTNRVRAPTPATIAPLSRCPERITRP